MFARHYVVDEDSEIVPRRLVSKCGAHALVKEKLLPAAAIVAVLGLLGYLKVASRW